MGFSTSWLACKGISKKEVLRRCRLRDTGVEQDIPETRWSGADLTDDWYVVQSENAEDLTRSKVMSNVSRGCLVVACGVEEHAMVSTSAVFQNGSLVWSITHNASRGAFHLDTRGTLPKSYDDVRDHYAQLQRNDQVSVDHVFDTPIEMARLICGYRYDEVDYPWGTAAFTKLSRKWF